MTHAQPHEVRYDVHGESTQTERVPGVDVIAAFDFDGTLTRGGSVWKWLSSLVGRAAVTRAGAALAPSLARAAVVGGEAADTAKEALFVRTLAGLDAEEVAACGVAFGRHHYHRHSRTQVRARVDWHRRQGHVLILVSASPELYVAPVGEELGFDGVLATRLEVDRAGLLTGHFDGRNCRGPEKLRRLDEWLEDLWEGTAHGSATPGERPFLWAYGNSAGDRQLLAAADIGVDAGRLGRLGSLRRYRRLGDVLTAW